MLNRCSLSGNSLRFCMGREYPVCHLGLFSPTEQGGKSLLWPCKKENSQSWGETMTQNIMSLSYQLWSYISAAWVRRGNYSADGMAFFSSTACLLLFWMAPSWLSLTDHLQKCLPILYNAYWLLQKNQIQSWPHPSAPSTCPKFSLLPWRHCLQGWPVACY